MRAIPWRIVHAWPYIWHIRVTNLVLHHQRICLCEALIWLIDSIPQRSLWTHLRLSLSGVKSLALGYWYGHSSYLWLYHVLYLRKHRICWRLCKVKVNIGVDLTTNELLPLYLRNHSLELMLPDIAHLRKDLWWRWQNCRIFTSKITLRSLLLQNLIYITISLFTLRSEKGSWLEIPSPCFTSSVMLVSV